MREGCISNCAPTIFKKIKQINKQMKINQKSRAGGIMIDRRCGLMIIKPSFLTDLRNIYYSRPHTPGQHFSEETSPYGTHFLLPESIKM